MISSERARGVVSLIALALGFGAIALFGRFLGDYSFTPLPQLYLAYGVGFIVSLFLFGRTLSVSRLTKLSQRDWLIMFSRVIIGYLIGGSLYRASLVLTKISNVTFIQSIPVAAIFGFVLFKEKFTVSKALLLVLSYVGVIIISVKDYSSILSVGKGELFSLISAVLFSFSYVARKWQSDSLNDGEISQILLFLGFVILLGVSLLTGETLPRENFSLGVAGAIFVSGFLNATNIFLINYGFRRVEAVLASNILTIEAVFALILALVFYHEFPSLIELAGGILILGSVIQMNRLERS